MMHVITKFNIVLKKECTNCSKMRVVTLRSCTILEFVGAVFESVVACFSTSSFTYDSSVFMLDCRFYEFVAG